MWESIRRNGWYIKLKDKRVFKSFVMPLLSFFLLSIVAVYYRPVIGAALLGAGPPILYAIYKEVFDQPDVKLQTEAIYSFRYTHTPSPNVMKPQTNEAQSDGGVTQTIYARDFNLNPLDYRKDPGYIFPIFEVSAIIKNIGRRTAKNCSIQARVSDNADFFGRWSLTNDIRFDLNPGQSQYISVMRFLPKLDRQTQIKVDKMYKNSEFKLELAKEYNFHQIGNAYLDQYNTESFVSVDSKEFYPTRPADFDYETSLFRRGNMDPKSNTMFYSTPLTAKEDYNLSLTCTADDWANYCGFLNISSKDILDKMSPLGRPAPGAMPLIEALIEEQWIKEEAIESTDSKRLNEKQRLLADEDLTEVSYGM